MLRTTLHGAAPAGPRCHTLLTSVCFYGARETNRETRELFSIELVCTVHKHNTPMAAVPPRGRVAVASVLARGALSLYTIACDERSALESAVPGRRDPQA